MSKALTASSTTLRRCRVHKGCVTKAEGSGVEESDILGLNTKGFVYQDWQQRGWLRREGHKSSRFRYQLCVCVANKIYLAALPEALPTSTAKVTCEYKLPALSHPGTFNSPLSDIPFHSLPCLPKARYRCLHISSTGLGSDPRPDVTYEPRVIHSPSNTETCRITNREVPKARRRGVKRRLLPPKTIL